MPDTRLIKLYLDDDTKEKIAEITGYKNLQAAIGYLTAWNMSFGHVTIVADAGRSIELQAVYRHNEEAEVGYVIGAVWHDDPKDPTGGHFGFHS